MLVMTNSKEGCYLLLQLLLYETAKRLIILRIAISFAVKS